MLQHLASSNYFKLKIILQEKMAKINATVLTAQINRFKSFSQTKTSYIFTDWNKHCSKCILYVNIFSNPKSPKPPNYLSSALLKCTSEEACISLKFYILKERASTAWLIWNVC